MDAINSLVDRVVVPYAVSVAILAAAGTYVKKTSDIEGIVYVLAAAAVLNLESCNAWIDFVVPSYSMVLIALVVASAKKRPSVKEIEPEKVEEPVEVEEEEEVPAGKPHFGGTWKMQSCDNYAGYLEAVRIGPIMRKAMVRVPVSQIIVQRGDKVEITLKTIVAVKTLYHIDGPPTTSSIRNDKFQDEASWDGSDLIVVKKNITKNFTITARRQIKGEEMHVLTTVTTLNGSRPDANFVQIFSRVSPSK